MNLENTMTAVKASAPENDSQVSGTSRDPQVLLAQWDSVWSAYRRGKVPYRAVTTWCEGLTDAQGETLWDLLQRRAAMDEIAA